VFEPVELLEKLAAITPRPEANLIICHGVLAPHARLRPAIVAYGQEAPDPADATPDIGLAAGPNRAGRLQPPRYWSWAALMHRAFETDVLACPHCGGRLRFIATVHDPRVVRQILAHLALAHAGQSPGPAPPAPISGP